MRGYKHLGKKRIGGSKLVHRQIVEAIRGKPLPPGAVVHHVDGNCANNATTNLVICPDEKYHKLLHARQRALVITGDPNKRTCAYCGEWDDMKNMSPFYARGYHKRCAAAYQYGRRGRRA